MTTLPDLAIDTATVGRKVGLECPAADALADLFTAKFDVLLSIAPTGNRAQQLGHHPCHDICDAARSGGDNQLNQSQEQIQPRHAY
jgi:hypothetical protein